MFAVVNHMTLSRPIDPDVLERVQTELIPLARTVDGLRDAHIVMVAGEALIFVVLCDTAEALGRLHSEIAGPWIGANIRPFVSHVDRRVGQVVASTRP